MGRIKGFFCSFCLDSAPDQSVNDHSFNHGIDVSHLATPHTSSPTPRTISNNINTPARDINTPNTINDNENYPEYNDQLPTQGCAISSQHQNQFEVSPSDRVTPDRDAVISRPSSYHQQQNHSIQHEPVQNSQRSLSTPRIPSPSNLYEHHHQQPPQPPQPQQPQQQQQQQQQQHHRPPSPNHMQQQYNNPNIHANLHPDVQNEAPHSSYSNGTTTKLSYDIISVREPLAKILAEKQQLLQAQQLQRQLLGDHEYIEVYGDRGSSCFYEEIAGSVTSSAIYDQIGSSHNYQVLINAYAVAHRQNALNTEENLENGPQEADLVGNHLHDHNNIDRERANLYTSPSDQVDGIKPNNNPTAADSSHPTADSLADVIEHRNNDERMAQAAQSIPVYSVINKATRKNNLIFKNAIENNRPPRPPPKNLYMSQGSTSAMNHTYNEPSDDPQPSCSSHQKAWSPAAPNSTKSSYLDNNSNEILSEDGGTRSSRLPQPPPRFSKLSAFKATDRPLPLPDGNHENNCINNNNINENGKIVPTSNISPQDEDIESLNNGYELLRSNLEDDQIDFGYEKIRETNRYSGGSLSSQLYQIQLFDNGGYESVQPIYSSPSNALVEPNYEAIAPATASELAAAATAKLTAAATVIEQMYSSKKSNDD